MTDEQFTELKTRLDKIIELGEAIVTRIRLEDARAERLRELSIPPHMRMLSTIKYEPTQTRTWAVGQSVGTDFTPRPE